MTNTNQVMEIMTKKFILDLNAALAMENAGVGRLQTRIQEVSLPEVQDPVRTPFTRKQRASKKIATSYYNYGW